LQTKAKIKFAKLTCLRYRTAPLIKIHCCKRGAISFTKISNSKAKYSSNETITTLKKCLHLQKERPEDLRHPKLHYKRKILPMASSRPLKT